MSTQKTIPMLIAASAVVAFVVAGPASADPPPCTNPDGTPCDTNVIDPNGATGAIPGGPSGTARPDIVSGGIPGGPTGSVTPGEVSGCIPGIGCINVPR